MRSCHVLANYMFCCSSNENKWIWGLGGRGNSRWSSKNILMAHMTIKTPNYVHKRSIFKHPEHLQLLLSAVLCSELHWTQHSTTLNKCHILCTVWKRIICEAKVNEVRFSAVFIGDKHLERECEHLQTQGYNVNIVPYRFINDLYPDTGSELQSQMNYEWVTP